MAVQERFDRSKMLLELIDLGVREISRSDRYQHLIVPGRRNLARVAEILTGGTEAHRFGATIVSIWPSSDPGQVELLLREDWNTDPDDEGVRQS